MPGRPKSRGPCRRQSYRLSPVCPELDVRTKKGVAHLSIGGCSAEAVLSRLGLLAHEPEGRWWQFEAWTTLPTKWRWPNPANVVTTFSTAASGFAPRCRWRSPISHRSWPSTPSSRWVCSPRGHDFSGPSRSCCAGSCWSRSSSVSSRHASHTPAASTSGPGTPKARRGAGRPHGRTSGA